MTVRARAAALAVGLWALVVAGANATRPFEGGLRGTVALESLAVGLLLLALALSSRLRSLLGAIGRVRALWVIALLALVLWGQLARDNRASFPFLHWSMYTSPTPANEYLDFEVRYRSGRTGLFPFGALATFSGSRFVASQGRALEARAAQWLAPARGGPVPQSARAELAKLVATYNARHRDDPIATLIVARRRVPIRDFAGRTSVLREPLLEMDFDE